MRVSGTKTAPRIERNTYLFSKKIKGYGDGNDYPQKILEIVGSSGTGKTCVDITVKFVKGAGFVDPTFNNHIINTKQERVSTLLSKITKDLVNFNGFACLVKYNGLGEPSEFYNIPFEHCRIEIDGDKEYTGRIAVYPDWTNITGKIFRQKDVKFLNRYNPKTVIEEMTTEGGPEDYLGQIYYYTADGDFEYPISPFDPIITDMLTEESCSTVKHRNAKYNFLPGGILVRKGIKPVTLPDGSTDPDSEYNREQEESRQEILNMQGDENACKLWVVDIDSDEEVPELIPFQARSLDKEYTYTEESVQENIGRMFMIPPILRGVDIGAGFGATLMTEAYNFMNSVTQTERDSIKSAFMDIFKYYPIEFSDVTIKPLTYIV